MAAAAAVTAENPAAEAQAAGATEGAATAPRRRRGGTDECQVVDELAQESRRAQLLDRVEQQLRDQARVSRLLMVFGIADDRKVQSTVTQEFLTWREKEGLGETITGVLVFVAQHAVQLIEGPTEDVFRGLEFFQSLALEQLGGDGSKGKAGDADRGNAVASPTTGVARPAMIGAVRILHFTELHGVRTSRSWCSYLASGKLHGGTQVVIDDSNQSELVFALYKKMMDVCLQVTAAVGNSVADVDSRLQSLYRNAGDLMPTADEMVAFTGKSAAEMFFSYPEFHKVFMAPFHMVLHSELLWPMPPALSY